MELSEESELAWTSREVLPSSWVLLLSLRLVPPSISASRSVIKRWNRSVDLHDELKHSGRNIHTVALLFPPVAACCWTCWTNFWTLADLFLFFMPKVLSSTAFFVLAFCCCFFGGMLGVRQIWIVNLNQNAVARCYIVMTSYRLQSNPEWKKKKTKSEFGW